MLVVQRLGACRHLSDLSNEQPEPRFCNDAAASQQRSTNCGWSSTTTELCWFHWPSPKASLFQGSRTMLRSFISPFPHRSVNVSSNQPPKWAFCFLWTMFRSQSLGIAVLPARLPLTTAPIFSHLCSWKCPSPPRAFFFGPFPLD